MNSARRGICRFIFLAILFFAVLPAANAGDWEGHGPLQYRTQNPIYLQFLNPEPERSKPLDKGEVKFLTYVQYSNVFELSNGANLGERLDMELGRTVFSIDVGVGEGMEVGIDVPVIYFWRGFLDPFIQKFHNFFHFPNGGRELVPNNQFTYAVNQRDSSGNWTKIYGPDKPMLNLSDTTLHLKHKFIDETAAVPGVAWMFYLKVPTGNCADGSGNGGVDYGFAAAFEKSYKRFHAYLNLGYYVSQGHQFLEDYVNHEYFSGNLSLELNISHPVSVIAQIHGGTPITKGMGTSEWDSFPLDLIIGFQGYHKEILAGQDFTWQVGFAEDLNSNGPSIDFTALVTLGIIFGGQRGVGESLF